jgi:DNA polymerase sigma
MRLYCWCRRRYPRSPRRSRRDTSQRDTRAEPHLYNRELQRRTNHLSQANINHFRSYLDESLQGPAQTQLPCALETTLFMPCPFQLLRLRDSRHALHHISRHAVTCPSHQLRHYASGARQAARLKARVAALKRLDQHINPDDLSATLEAHREANRASIIRKTITDTDPEVKRPSFLADQEPRIRIRHVKPFMSEQENEELKTALAQFHNLVTKISDAKDDATTFQLRSLERAAEAAKNEQAQETKRTNNGYHYSRWFKFLIEHENPLEPIPPYRLEDRTAFFTVMRRVFTILRTKQRDAKTMGPVEDLAPRHFMLYDGFPRPIINGLKGYARQEAWSRRPIGQGTKYTMKHWLETEILAFAEWMEMTPSETAARAKLSDTLIELCQQADPILRAETFGSQSTGLTMPNSDIDIRINDSTLEHIPYKGDPEDKAAKAAWAAEKSTSRKTRMISHLRTIQSSLVEHEDFDKVELKESAYFPLVRAVHVHTGLKIQIVSTRDTRASREAMKKYMARYATLKPVFLVLKTALHLRNLSDPWLGGVGSYTLFMMCVAAFKHADTQQRTLKKRSLSLDFLHTLHFWSEFDTSRVALSVDPFVMFPKKTRPGARAIEDRKKDPSLWARHRIAQPLAYKPYMLHLQDPADPYNDLGRSALAIKDLQATFAKLYEDLTWEMQDPSRRSDATALLKSVVGRSERYFDEMRIPVDLWGSQFVEEGEGEEEVWEIEEDEQSSRLVLEEASPDAVTEPLKFRIRT